MRPIPSERRSTPRALALALVAVATACASAADDADRCSPRARCVPSFDGGASTPDAAVLDGAISAPLDATCATIETVAEERRRPVDVIVLPDDSSSMGEARTAVVDAMESTFRAAMDAEGIDHRVIWHGRSALPALEAAGRLVRNPVRLGSDDDAMFTPVLDSYEEWRAALRPDALRVIVHFTDARGGDGGGIDGFPGALDTALSALDRELWGAPGSPRFVYHAFVGVPPSAPPGSPYEPADPVVAGTCSSRVRNPVPLQELARRTGGLRFPLCEPEAFDAVFSRIAASAIERATLRCELEVPSAPPGREVDLATLAVRHSSGSGGTRLLRRAVDESECDGERFLLLGDERIQLCPAACEVVQADRSGALTVLTGCSPELY